MTKEGIAPPKLCTKTEAEALTDRIRKGVDELWSLLLEAHERKAWTALGYATWEAYVRAEFDMSRRTSYRLLDQATVMREIEAVVPTAAQISQRDAEAIRGDLPTVTTEIKARVEAGEKPDKAVAEVVADARAAAKAKREAEQANNDRQREQARAALPDAIKRAEATKAANGSHHAAVTGKQPVPPAETPDQIAAHRDELLEENEALRKDVAGLTARLVKFDDMAVQWEKGGFEAVIATRDERIRNLSKQVEDVSAERATAVRQRDFWKKTAMGLGYVSQHSVVETADVGADDGWEPF